MIIYKVTNLVNGKIYIGKTVQKLNVRKNKHFRDAKAGTYNSMFHAAIRKYGESNFIWEIIDRGFFIELEKFYIEKYNCKIPNGYNMTDGGKGMCGHIPSDEARLKRSNSLKNRYFSPEHRAKLSAAQIGEKSSWFGRKHTVETIAKMSMAHSGKNHWNFKKHTSMETRNKISISLKNTGAQIGNKNPSWIDGRSKNKEYLKKYHREWYLLHKKNKEDLKNGK